MQYSSALAEPVRERLVSADYCVVSMMLNAEAEWRRCLQQEQCDLVIIDAPGADCDFAAVARTIRQQAPDIPVIVSTDSSSENVAADALDLDNGARDYILRGHLHRLLPAVERELRNAGFQEEWRQNQQALRQSEESHRALVEMSPDAIVVIVDDKIAFVNSACAAMCGVDHPRHLIGCGFLEFVYPAERDKIREQLKRASAQAQRTETAFLRIVTGKGVILHVEAVATPAKFENREALHVILRDVTKRKQAQARLREMNRKLKLRAQQLQLLAARLTQVEENERRRIAVILHDDLQQLLVGAKFRLGALPRQFHNPRVGTGLGKISALLDKCIDVSRSLTHDLSPPILQEAGLGAGLRWLARVMHQKYGLTVAVQEEMDTENVDADIAIFLYQAVRELLTNVVKHAGTHSAVVHLSAPDSMHIQIMVEDEGSGFVADAEGKDKQRFGILTIKERLELMGGSLTTCSSPGKGTCVTLLAPAAIAPKQRLSQRTPDHATTEAWQPLAVESKVVQPTIRIMLADDHVVMRHGLALLLEEESDFEVVAEVSDGAAAVAQAIRLRPDVILMDVNMPCLSGVEATKQIIGKAGNISIIGLSMHDARDMREKMMAAGACDYVEKGGPPDTLLNVIRERTADRIAVGKPSS